MECGHSCNNWSTWKEIEEGATRLCNAAFKIHYYIKQWEKIWLQCKEQLETNKGRLIAETLKLMKLADKLAVRDWEELVKWGWD